MAIYGYGSAGAPLNVEGQALSTTTSPSGNLYPFKYGETGRAVFVDERGRLLVCLDGGSTSSTSGCSYVKEDLSDQIDGPRVNFTLSRSPASDSVFRLYWNGLRMREGSQYDFIVVGQTLTTNFVAYQGNSLKIDYSCL